jgi:hypothetical protein
LVRVNVNDGVFNNKLKEEEMRADMLKIKPDEISQPEVLKEDIQFLRSKGFDVQFINEDDAIYWNSNLGGYWTYSKNGEELQDADNPRDLAIFAEGYNKALEKEA